MQEKTWTFKDKSAWGGGPWDAEPDKVQWTDKATGLPCLIVRGPVGNLCGYVGVTQGHPFFGKDYDAVHAMADINVHGGFTFADKCSGDEHGICHVVEPGEDDNVWWLGFDFAHLDDLSPSMRQFEEKWRREIPNYADYHRHEHYWTIAEVQAECANVAAQIAAATGAPTDGAGAA